MLKGSLGFWRILGVGGFKVHLENVMEPFLVGGFNPSQKYYLVKLDENKTYLKPPPSFHVHGFFEAPTVDASDLCESSQTRHTTLMVQKSQGQPPVGCTKPCR